MSSTHHRNHIVTLLENLAREHPALPLYTFLDAAQKSVAVLTSSDLLRKATQIAGLLQGQVLAGKPVLVLSPHGPAFLESLFGVMLAGCVPVPVTFSRRLGMANIADIIADTGVEAVLGPKKTLEN
ncbi:MAG: AMP-binding protein, partial [Pseudohongiella sp.]